jgi:hypothetical protein
MHQANAATGGAEMRNAAERLDSDGFVLLTECCPVALAEQFLAVARRRISEVMAALGSRPIGIGSAAGYVELVQRSPGRWDLPISPARFGTNDRSLPWWPLVSQVLGDDAEHSFSGVVFSEPGSPEQQWHIDSPHVDARHRPAHALNVLLALHDIPLEMGPTEMARGSQVLTNHLRNPRLACDELVYQSEKTSPEALVAGRPEATPETWAVPLPSGACLVFDDRILHRGLANRSKAERYVAYFSYRKRGYVGDTHFESTRSLFTRDRAAHP